MGAGTCDQVWYSDQHNGEEVLRHCFRTRGHKGDHASTSGEVSAEATTYVPGQFPSSRTTPGWKTASRKKA